MEGKGLSTVRNKFQYDPHCGKILNELVEVFKSEEYIVNENFQIPSSIYDKIKPYNKADFEL